MANNLSVSRLVNVAVTLSPRAAARRNFGVLLIAGNTAVIDTSERIRTYTTLEGVAEDFGTSDPEYLAALDFFSQSPRPAILMIGRWARTATKAVLRGDIRTSAEQALANFTAITSGGFAITIDGTVRTLSSIDLSAATTLNGVAAIIQTGLSTWATCVWDAVRERFDITSTTTGATSTISTVTSTPLSAALGITTAAGATIVAGIAAESAAACAVILADKSSDWYGLVFADTNAVDADHLAVAAYVEAASISRIYGVTTQDTGALDANDDTDIASTLKAANYSRAVVQYSSTDPYAVVSLLGRLFTVDFTGNKTTVTAKFKQQPGVVAEALTESQAAALAGKNCNVFAAYNNDTAIIQEGTMANGDFIDERHGLDWLQNAAQTDLFNRLYQSKTKIPQTNAGVHQLITTLERTLAQGRTNGLIAPGVWMAEDTGPVLNGQYLPKGFQVYAQSVDDQSQADREARVAPLLEAVIKLAGAVHSVDVALSVNR